MDNVNLTRQPDETELQYVWRLGGYKENGLIDMTWTGLAEVLNKNLRDPDEYFTESSYRKKFSLLKQAKEEVFGKATSGSELQDLVALRQELEKERIKLRDERTDYRRMLREEARNEKLWELLGESVSRMNAELPLLTQGLGQADTGDREALLCLSDWHYGMVTKNIWNEYNPEICRERVARVVGYAKTYLEKNEICKLSICLLGDLCHGICHLNRMQSCENFCDQIIKVSELLAESIHELSTAVNKVDVYYCYGNHMRSAQNKEESLYDDNLEKLIPWWLKERLSSNEKINIVNTNMYGYTLLSLCGYNIACVHGDGYNFKDIGMTANALFSKAYGIDIDYTISGDKHHHEEFEQFGIESILIQSLCGTDDYANDKRLYGKAGQTLMIFNTEYGRECTYTIPV